MEAVFRGLDAKGVAQLIEIIEDIAIAVAGGRISSNV
jgi:hypothetical protein